MNPAEQSSISSLVHRARVYACDKDARMPNKVTPPAFPSMHVASSALITLFAFSYARWAGWVMVVFTAIILLGSVALAWHYAVDGYAGIALAYVFWRAGLWITAAGARLTQWPAAPAALRSF